MTQTTLYAPVHIIPGKPAIGNFSNNPDRAPQLRWGAGGMLDGRLPYSQGNRKDGAVSSILCPNLIGLYGEGALCVLDQAPATLGAANIAAAANVVNGTAMTLAGASTGITVLGSALSVLPAAAANASGSGLASVPAAALVLDGNPGYVKFGAGFQTWFYDPTTMLQRAVTITGVSGGAGGNFLISGYDAYGYAMSQLLTVGAGAVTATTTKTFKFITSVVPQFTDAHNYSVGTADVFGLGLASDAFAYCDILWNGVLALLATYTAADATSPATTTTGDVRGTFAPASASNGTKKVQAFVTLSAARVANAGGVHIGQFGVPQV